MRNQKALAIAVMALCGSQAALGGSQAYVVSNWVAAMNNVDDSGCPQGLNPRARDIMIRTLNEQGLPQEEIDKLTDPAAVSTTEHYARYTAMRGKEDGKPAKIYTHPLSVPDPHIKLDQALEGFGFNLDGKDGPLDYTDPLTKEKGVDNAVARLLGCFDRTRGTREVPSGYLSYRWTTYNLGNSWLVEVTNNSSKPLDLHSEGDVTVKFYRGLQPALKNSAGFQRNVTYTIDPDPRLKSLTSFKGRIKDGMFVSDVTPEFRMLASGRLNPVFDFKSVRMRMSFRPDGTVQGFVGGYLPIKQVYFPFANDGVFMESIGNIDLPGFYYALYRNADTDIDRDRQTGQRTRISQTYYLQGMPAFLGRVSTANN
jgi:hypothetical protein